jgi:hypothetical protein
VHPKARQSLRVPAGVRRGLTSAAAAGNDSPVNPLRMACLAATSVLWGGLACAQQPAPAGPQAFSEAEVISEPVPPEVVASAQAAVGKLGEEVVLGRYQVALERMNPLWKERAATRMGGMKALEKQLSGVPAQMVQQGISMISFKPQGQPRTYQVSPGRKVVKENGVDVEKFVYTKWMVLVPTATRFRIMRSEQGRPPKVMTIESTGYQVAISDKGKNDWTFIDGAGLRVSDLRGLFITLPQDMELPPVGKKEIR